MDESNAITLHVWGPVEDATARLIMQHEGLRLSPYRDTLGNWTVGYGHRLPVAIPGLRITEAHAKRQLSVDIGVAITAVHRWLDGRGDGVEGPRWGCLVDVAFNVGYRSLCGFHRMRAAVIACDWGRAACELLDSRWAVQVPNRAAVDAEIMRTGGWPWTKNAGAS